MKKRPETDSFPRQAAESSATTNESMIAFEQSLVPLQVIRTETVISRLPIHNLVKGGDINIQISHRNEQGKVHLHWEVSPSSRFGHPGQLAYKLDTIVINRLIDEIGRPVPKLLKIGTLNQLSQELGSQKAELKQALRQNAATTISAKLDYKGNDGQARKLEAIFARYSVVFTGETLPSGEKADEIYIIFNDPYLEVLNSAPVRPLNYDYLKELSPTAQRFYEIISYRIYAALKYQHPAAKLTYSEYCTYSAQRRHEDFERMRLQMYRVHKPHLESNYLLRVEVREIASEDGKPDWLILYTPGLKAKAEYESFHRKTLAAMPPQTTALPEKVAGWDSEALSTTASRDQSSASVENDAATPPVPLTTDSAAIALKLVQYFHACARRKIDYVPRKGSRELQQAAALLAEHGEATVHFIIDYAVSEARKTNFQMRTFGALLQYVADGAQVFAAARQREKNIIAAPAVNQEESDTGLLSATSPDAYEQAEQRLQSLPADEYQNLYDKVKKRLLADHGEIVRRFDNATLETTIRAGMRSALMGS